jgi:serine/threonine protein kinase
VIHGNLKPQLIALDTENSQQIHPYVSDFGIAAKGGAGKGRVVYTAPEQYGGGEITHRADLYAYGIILYQCFSGHLLADETEIMAIPPAERRYAVRQVRPEVPIGVDLVIDRLTRPDPAERYATATAAVEALTHAFYSGQGALEGRVFISYAHKDQDYVHRLAKQLRSVGVDLWIDQDIAPGVNWDKQIEEALNACDQMLLVFSPAALISENVHDEWSYFLERGKAVHIYIHETCELPFRLRRRQYFLSKGDLLADVSQIVDVLAGGNPNRSNV